MIGKEEVISFIKELDPKGIKFGVTDIDGVLRGKLISTDKFLKALDQGIGFCNVIFGWDMNDACYDNTTVSGWHTGYPDEIAHIDPNSLRRIPWDENIPFFIADFRESKQMDDICPRSMLHSIHQQAKDLGFLAKFGAEFEWYNFNETPDSLKEKNYLHPSPMSPGMFGYSVLRLSQRSDYVNDLFELLLEFGIPLEGIHTETGDGVYEACIEYDEIENSADRAALFKTAVKEIASRHGIMASFMAKWNMKLPGCSGHIHQSLWDEKGKRNLFYDANRDHHMSEIMESYIAGQLHCMPYIMPIYAPTLNSYRRYVEGSWAPTTLSWGHENRTTALRVIARDEGNTRLENRVPGSDANPYLTMAASLASGLYGIRKKMKLNLSPTTGNEYNEKNRTKLPSNLHQATLTMKESSIPEELFGTAFTEHFIKTRDWEWRQHDPQVANWELKRYFEVI